MIFIVFFTFSLLQGFKALAVKYAQKNYITKISESIFYTILISFIQLLSLFLLPPYYKYGFSPDMLVYPAFFAVFNMITNTLFILALKEGPTSITNVIYSFQSIVPVITGMIIWKERISLFQWSGLTMFAIILYLFNKGSYNNEGEVKKITLKWLVLACLCTIFAGIAIIFTKQYMLEYKGFIKEYLILYNLFVVLAGIPFLVFIGLKKKSGFVFKKRFLIYVAFAALMQNIINIIYMSYITKFKSALFFPLMSILNIISVVIISRLVLKERMSKLAYIAIILSFAAIYLLGMK